MPFTLNLLVNIIHLDTGDTNGDAVSHLSFHYTPAKTDRYQSRRKRNVCLQLIVIPQKGFRGSVHKINFAHHTSFYTDTFLGAEVAIWGRLTTTLCLSSDHYVIAIESCPRKSLNILGENLFHRSPKSVVSLNNMKPRTEPKCYAEPGNSVISAGDAPFASLVQRRY